MLIMRFASYDFTRKWPVQSGRNESYVGGFLADRPRVGRDRSAYTGCFRSIACFSLSSPTQTLHKRVTKSNGESLCRRRNHEIRFRIKHLALVCLLSVAGARDKLDCFNYLLSDYCIIRICIEKL